MELGGEAAELAKGAAGTEFAGEEGATLSSAGGGRKRGSSITAASAAASVPATAGPRHTCKRRGRPVAEVGEPSLARVAASPAAWAAAILVAWSSTAWRTASLGRL